MRWETPRKAPWLGSGEIHADAVTDLRTMDNILSFWLINDDQKELKRIVAATAASRDRIDKIDCALVDEDIVLKNGFIVIQSPGASPDQEANQLWHRDLTCLSGTRLVDLAIIIQKHMRPKRYLKEDIKLLIRDGLDKHQIDYDKLKEGIKRDFKIER